MSFKCKRKNLTLIHGIFKKKKKKSSEVSRLKKNPILGLKVRRGVWDLFNTFRTLNRHEERKGHENTFRVTIFSSGVTNTL